MIRTLQPNYKPLSRVLINTYKYDYIYGQAYTLISTLLYSTLLYINTYTSPILCRGAMPSDFLQLKFVHVECILRPNGMRDKGSEASPLLVPLLALLGWCCGVVVVVVVVEVVVVVVVVVVVGGYVVVVGHVKKEEC